MTSTFTQKIDNEIDILFMVDDSSSMRTTQDKLVAQLPVFMQVLKNLPMGLPSLHVAVVTSDMGAHSDFDIACTDYEQRRVSVRTGKDMYKYDAHGRQHLHFRRERYGKLYRSY